MPFSSASATKLTNPNKEIISSVFISCSFAQCIFVATSECPRLNGNASRKATACSFSLIILALVIYLECYKRYNLKYYPKCTPRVNYDHHQLFYKHFTLTADD